MDKCPISGIKKEIESLNLKCSGIKECKECDICNVYEQSEVEE